MVIDGSPPELFLRDAPQKKALTELFPFVFPCLPIHTPQQQKHIGAELWPDSP